MLVPQVVEGEGSGQPSEPQPPSSTALPSLEEQVTTVASQPQKTHTPRRAKIGQDTEIPQSSSPPKKVGDEAVYTGEDDRVVRAATTVTSLEAEQESGDADAQTRFKTASKQSHDLPLSEVNTSGSEEDSMEHQDDLTNFVAPTPHDSPLSGGHTPGSDKGVKLFKIGISRRKSLDKENVYKQGRNLKTRPMFEEGDFDDDFDDIDDMVNEAMENVERDIVNAGGAVNTATTGVSVASASMRSQKAKEKGVAFRDVEESARSTTILPTIDPKDKGKGIMQEPKKPPKNPIKAQIQRDAKIAQRLFEEEQAQFEREQRIVGKRAAEQRSKPPTKAQMRNRMCTYLKNQAGYNHNQLKGRMIKDSGKKDDSSSKQAGSKKKEQVFSTMLEEFDRQDLFDLHRLVMKRFEFVALEGYDLILWGDLKTMIKPNKEDEV
ncbi:hypothetical protein Tco_1377865 [Tanacetum coccineum]